MLYILIISLNPFRLMSHYEYFCYSLKTKGVSTLYVHYSFQLKNVSHYDFVHSTSSSLTPALSAARRICTLAEIYVSLWHIASFLAFSCPICNEIPFYSTGVETCSTLCILSQCISTIPSVQTERETLSQGIEIFVALIWNLEEILGTLWADLEWIVVTKCQIHDCLPRNSLKTRYF